MKECDIVGKWAQSIVNLLYWCVVSTTPDDSKVVKAKWLSLENHIHDVHSGHSEQFPTAPKENW